MIASGELDCVIIARPPDCFRQGHPDVVRLFPDFENIERRYYQETRVYPIMHVIALRKALLADNSSIARNLFNAFEESKRRALERLLDPAVSRYPVPWLTNYVRRTAEACAELVKKRGAHALAGKTPPRVPGGGAASTAQRPHQQETRP